MEMDKFFKGLFARQTLAVEVPTSLFWSSQVLPQPVLNYDCTMRFIGYDSIQTLWFISYRFQIRTIT